MPCLGSPSLTWDTPPKNLYFLLNEKNEAVACHDRVVWIRWFEEGGNRRLAEDWIGNVQVSMVFLGKNYNWQEGVPMLFETMIFGGSRDLEIWRYETYEDAQKSHTRVVAMIKEGSLNNEQKV